VFAPYPLPLPSPPTASLVVYFSVLLEDMSMDAMINKLVDKDQERKSRTESDIEQKKG
jgi:hypothetical protein